jgi:hypothetical protein
MITRIGKIARLPHALREELNLRLADGAPAEDLLDWVHECEGVDDMLHLHFDGRAITVQNLSAWKQGGFVDWQRAQEIRALAGRFVTDAEEVAAESGAISLADRLSATVALTLAQLLRAALDGDAPDRRQAVLEIARELSRLRRGDHQQARVAFARERWVTQRQEAEVAAEQAEEAALEAKIEKLELETQKKADFTLWCYYNDLRNGTMSAEERATKEAHFAAHPEFYGKQWQAAAAATPPAKPSTQSPTQSWARPSAPPSTQPVAASATVKPGPASPAQPPASPAAAQGKSRSIKPNQGSSSQPEPPPTPAASKASAATDPRPNAGDAAPHNDGWPVLAEHAT